MFVVLCLSALALAEEAPPTAPAAPVEEAAPAEPASPAAPAEPAAPSSPPVDLLGSSPESRAAYEEGRRLGVEAARAQAVIAPAVVAGAIGFGLSAPAVLLVGPCCGAPAISVAALAPGVLMSGREPDLPQGWQTGEAVRDYAYSQAYSGTLKRRKSATMLIFGAVGAAAGVGVGMITTKILLDEWGYTG